MALSPACDTDRGLWASLGAGQPNAYRSTDGGVNYGLQAGGPLYGRVVVISPGFAGDNTVWVGAYVGLCCSTNAWGLLPGDLPAQNVTGLAVSPAYPTDQTMFAVVGDSAVRAYRTSNDGAHRTPLPLCDFALKLRPETPYTALTCPP